MKILHRLRELRAEAGMEEPVTRSVAPTIEREDIEFDECVDPPGEIGLFGSDSGPTVDGLRRRIPDLHEDFPPDALHLEDGEDALF